MSLLFVTEARFTKLSDGSIYADGPFGDVLWHRYLSEFKEVFVIARIETSDRVAVGKVKIDQTLVKFLPLPYYIGPLNFMRRYFRLNKAIKSYLLAHQESAFLFRVPGFLGHLAAVQAKKINHAYTLEVVGDPDEVFQTTFFNHPLKWMLRKMLKRNLKFDVRQASCVLYVTESVLQKKYPTEEGVFHIAASNVMLSEDMIQTDAKKHSKKEVYQIVSIGSLEQLYKAPDVLIEALKVVNSGVQNFKLRLTWVGGGRYLEQVKQFAAEQGVENDIIFTGNLNPKEVYNQLSVCDLYVHPARTEGLPRAIIEAMAMGLPCVATDVGGIPELLDKRCLVEPNNVEMLAAKLIEILSDENFYNQSAQNNLQYSNKYSPQILKERRKRFYKQVRKTKLSI